MQEDEMNNSLKRFKENAKREQEREESRQAIIKRLKTDPDIQEYFQQFSKMSVDSFIEDYAFKLELTLQHSDVYEDIYEKENTKYLEQAEKCLAEIQLKKLYDLRRLWGANALQVEGVKSSQDFQVMAHDLMNCTAVPAITNDEFNLYLRYAESPEFEYSSFTQYWLGLENALHGYGSDLPAWFAYCNLYSGNKVYTDLPDVRYKKEREYMDLSMQHNRREAEAKYESGEVARPVIDTRPMIGSYSYEDVLDFMTMFEEPEVVRKFEVMCEHGELTISKEDDLMGEDNPDWLNEQVESIMLSLGTMKDFILPVESSSDWRLALIHAWAKYEREEIINALPVAYDRYRFRLQNKIAMPLYGSDRELESAEIWKQHILKGRKIKGEPEDFNF